MKSVFSYLALALPCAVSGCNVVPRVDVSPAYGFFEVDGHFGGSSGGAVAEQSFDDVGLDEEEGGPMGRVSFNWLGFELMASGFQADFSGSGTTSASITLDGETIGAGASVDTDLDVTYLTGTVTYDIIPGDTLDLGLGLGVTAVDFDLKLTEDLTGIKIEGDETIPLPELAVRGAVRLGRAGVFARVGYVTGEYGDFDGSLLDADVYAQFRILGGDERIVAHLLAGYRTVNFDFDYDDGGDKFKADFDISGPYVGLTLSF